MAIASLPHCGTQHCHEHVRTGVSPSRADTNYSISTDSHCWHTQRVAHFTCHMPHSTVYSLQSAFHIAINIITIIKEIFTTIVNTSTQLKYSTRTAPKLINSNWQRLHTPHPTQASTLLLLLSSPHFGLVA